MLALKFVRKIEFCSKIPFHKQYIPLLQSANIIGVPLPLKRSFQKKTRKIVNAFNQSSSYMMIFVDCCRSIKFSFAQILAIKCLYNSNLTFSIFSFTQYICCVKVCQSYLSKIFTKIFIVKSSHKPWFCAFFYFY